MEHDRLSGLVVARLETPAGLVQVLFPDDAAAEDVISGTVVGEDDLVGWVVELPEERIPPEQGRFTWRVPGQVPEGAVDLVLRDGQGGEVARARMPVDRCSYQHRRPQGGPGSFQLPGLVPQGGATVLYGPFDGRMETTRITAGGRPLKLLAESPRKVVAQVPEALAGSVELQVDEDGRQAAALVGQEPAPLERGTQEAGAEEGSHLLSPGGGPGPGGPPPQVQKP